MSRPRDRSLLLATLAGFALWLFSIGLLRMEATDAGFRNHWSVGVAPSFFTGFTWAVWQAFAMRSGPLASAAGAVFLVILSEVVQIVLPRYTADPFDVVAGVAGAALAVPLIWFRCRRATSTAPASTSSAPPR